MKSLLSYCSMDGKKQDLADLMWVLSIIYGVFLRRLPWPEKTRQIGLY